MSASAKPPTSDEAGFSLVETVAAMGILALAAIPLLQISTDATRNSQHLERRLVARIVAENVLARHMTDPVQLSAGTTMGAERQLSQDFAWVLTASPPSDDGLQSLSVDVTLAGQDQVYARFEALKVGNLPLLTVAGEPRAADDEGGEN